MSAEEVTEIDHFLYYEVLNILIPRFLRVIGDGTPNTICQAFTKLGVRLGPNENLLSVVKWFHDATFFSLPGYLPINELDPMSIGLFPFDIASACAVSALGMTMKEKSLKVLDLCCCPGGKTQMIHDLLSIRSSHGNEGVNTSVIGVDISRPRLQVCISLLERTARFKFLENSKALLCPEKDQSAQSSCESSLVGGISVRSNIKGVESVTDSRSIQDEKNIGQKKGKPRLLLFNSDGTLFGSDTFGSLLFDSKVQDDELFHIFGRDKKGIDSGTESNITNLTRQNTTPGQLTSSDGNSEAECGFRKRKNKSARQREQRKILLVEKNDLHEIFSDEKSAADSSSYRARVKVLRGDRREKLTLDLEIEGVGTVGTEAGDETAPSATPITVTNCLTEKKSPLLKDGTFDYILVDAECSHDGSYRHMRYVPEEGEGTDTSSSLTCRAPLVVCTSTDDSSSNVGSDAVCSSNANISTAGSSSGTHSTMSKPGSARTYIGPDRVAERAGIVDLQRRLLKNGFRLLKHSNEECSPSASAVAVTVTGAVAETSIETSPSLVYSTCSLDEKQNEGVVQWLLDTHEDAELCPLDCTQLCGLSRSVGEESQCIGIKSEESPSDSTGRRGNSDGSEGGADGGEIEGSSEAETKVEIEAEIEAEADIRDLGLALSLIHMDQADLVQAVRAMGGLPVAMERLRRFSRLLSRHWSAQTVMPGYVSHCSDSATGHAHFAPPLPLSASALAPVNVGDAQSVSAAHLPGTVRLSVLNGTSGIFIAKIRKRMLPVKS